MAAGAAIGHDTLLFGIQEPKEPWGFPEGRIRWRIRNDQFVLARVKTPEGIREYYVEEENGYWIPAVEAGSTRTVESTRQEPTEAPPVFVVVSEWYSEGDQVETAMTSRNAAVFRADEIHATRNGNQTVRVERWSEGATEGEVIYRPEVKQS